MGGGGHSSSGGSGGLGGKLVGQLASNLFSSSNNKPAQPQNYHGASSSNPQNTGGLAGSVFGGVANMFGGNHAQNQVRRSVSCVLASRGYLLTDFS